ncbi:MAG: hypothetical protein ABSH15_04235 [Verrucomicrobiota bacterium]|jgi:hypothetical protein
MKSKLTLLITMLAMAASAFDIAYVDTTTVHTVGTNVIKGDQLSVAFGKINSNFGYLQTNTFQPSHRFVQFTTNAFLMTGSNYVGRFPQLYDWNLIAPQVGGGGLTPPTTLPESLWGSFDGTNNWFAITNGSVFWTNISLSVVGTNTSGIGGITIFGLDRPDLYTNVISFDGQILLTDGSKIASQAYVNSTIHVLAPPVQMAGSWVLDSYITNGFDHVVFSAHNAVALDMVSSASYVHIDSFTLDGTGTNALLQLAVTNLVPGWIVEYTTSLNYPILWNTLTTFTSVTNSGEITLTIPLNMTVPCTFFRARGGATTTTTINAVLALLPRTVTNSTDTTFGLGSGVVCIDTNYVYVSVATNRWKRAALSTW